MTNLNSSEINIDIIMAKIKEEAERIKSAPALPLNTQRAHGTQGRIVNIFLHQKETKIWKAVKKIQYLLQGFAFYGTVYKFAVKFKAAIPKYKR